MTRFYGHVGPAHIKDQIADRPTGPRIAFVADLLAWVRDTGRLSGF